MKFKNYFLLLICTLFFISCENPWMKDILDNFQDKKGYGVIKGYNEDAGYKIGDIGPAGGVIFYIDKAGFTMSDNGQICHYLEAASSDFGITYLWEAAGGLDILGTATALGTGRENTTLILAADNNAPAARTCADYNNYGFIDWFLPSLDELILLCSNNKSLIYSDYWSSSQYDTTSAWHHNVVLGGVSAYITKISPSAVRPIRAF